MGNGTSTAAAQVATPIQPTAPQYLNPSATNGVDFGWYPTSVSGLAGTSTQANNLPLVSQVQIDAAFDFYWIASTYFADTGSSESTEPEESTVLNPRVLVTITDTGSQRNLMVAPTPLTSIAGFGERPYRLVLPRLCRATSVLQFTWLAYGNISITYNYIYFVLHGFKVPAGQPYPF